LDDLLNNYQNPRLFIKKNIGASSVQITADFVDAEKKVFAFLLTNDEYTIELHSDNNAVRTLGNYVAATSGDKALHVYDIQAIPGTSTSTFRNGVSVYLGTTNISNSTFFAGLYNDTFNKTSRIDLYVYKMNYSGDILMHTQVNSSELYATLNLTPYDFTVVSEFITVDSYGVADNWKQMVKFVLSPKAIIKDFINTLANVTADTDEGAKTSIRWFFILVFSMIALTATIASSEYMALVLIGGIGLVWLLGWFPLPSNVPAAAVLGLLGAAALIAFFAMFKKKEKEI
jgi:hypothetical protein